MLLMLFPLKRILLPESNKNDSNENNAESLPLIQNFLNIFSSLLGDLEGYPENITSPALSMIISSSCLQNRIESLNRLLIHVASSTATNIVTSFTITSSTMILIESYGRCLQSLFRLMQHPYWDQSIQSIIDSTSRNVKPINLIESNSNRIEIQYEQQHIYFALMRNSAFIISVSINFLHEYHIYCANGYAEDSIELNGIKNQSQNQLSQPYLLEEAINIIIRICQYSEFDYHLHIPLGTLWKEFVITNTMDYNNNYKKRIDPSGINFPAGDAESWSLIRFPMKSKQDHIGSVTLLKIVEYQYNFLISTFTSITNNNIIGEQLIQIIQSVTLFLYEEMEKIYWTERVTGLSTFDVESLGIQVPFLNNHNSNSSGQQSKMMKVVTNTISIIHLHYNRSDSPFSQLYKNLSNSTNKMTKKSHLILLEALTKAANLISMFDNQLFSEKIQRLLSTLIENIYYVENASATFTANDCNSNFSTDTSPVAPINGLNGSPTQSATASTQVSVEGSEVLFTITSDISYLYFSLLSIIHYLKVVAFNETSSMLIQSEKGLERQKQVNENLLTTIMFLLNFTPRTGFELDQLYGYQDSTRSEVANNEGYCLKFSIPENHRYNSNKGEFDPNPNPPQARRASCATFIEPFPSFLMESLFFYSLMKGKPLDNNDMYRENKLKLSQESILYLENLRRNCTLGNLLSSLIGGEHKLTGSIITDDLLLALHNLITIIISIPSYFLRNTLIYLESQTPFLQSLHSNNNFGMESNVHTDKDVIGSHWDDFNTALHYLFLTDYSNNNCPLSSSLYEEGLVLSVHDDMMNSKSKSKSTLFSLIPMLQQLCYRTSRDIKTTAKYSFFYLYNKVNGLLDIPSSMSLSLFTKLYIPPYLLSIYCRKKEKNTKLNLKPPKNDYAAWTYLTTIKKIELITMVCFSLFSRHYASENRYNLTEQARQANIPGNGSSKSRGGREEFEEGSQPKPKQSLEKYMDYIERGKWLMFSGVENFALLSTCLAGKFSNLAGSISMYNNSHASTSGIQDIILLYWIYLSHTLMTSFPIFAVDSILSGLDSSNKSNILATSTSIRNNENLFLQSFLTIKALPDSKISTLMIDVIQYITCYPICIEETAEKDNISDSLNYHHHLNESELKEKSEVHAFNVWLQHQSQKKGSVLKFPYSYGLDMDKHYDNLNLLKLHLSSLQHLLHRVKLNSYLENILAGEEINYEDIFLQLESKLGFELDTHNSQKHQDGLQLVYTNLLNSNLTQFFNNFHQEVGTPSGGLIILELLLLEVLRAIVLYQKSNNSKIASGNSNRRSTRKLEQQQSNQVSSLSSFPSNMAWYYQETNLKHLNEQENFKNLRFLDSFKLLDEIVEVETLTTKEEKKRERASFISGFDERVWQKVNENESDLSTIFFPNDTEAFANNFILPISTFERLFSLFCSIIFLCNSSTMRFENVITNVFATLDPHHIIFKEKKKKQFLNQIYTVFGKHMETTEANHLGSQTNHLPSLLQNSDCFTKYHQKHTSDIAFMLTLNYEQELLRVQQIALGKEIATLSQAQQPVPYYNNTTTAIISTVSATISTTSNKNTNTNLANDNLLETREYSATATEKVTLSTSARDDKILQLEEEILVLDIKRKHLQLLWNEIEEKNQEMERQLVLDIRSTFKALFNK